jgi:16S rRNA pseudouridine516 synthase
LAPERGTIRLAMNLEGVLYSQGFGTRRQCRALIASGGVSVGGVVCDDPGAEFEVGEDSLRGFCFTAEGVAWRYRHRVYLALHKPAGYECSREPQHHPSVFELLPRQFAQRGVQCVGRLDQDTTGLLLLSDDGAFVHALTAPRRKVPKLYRITASHDVADAQLAALREGVLLRGEAGPVAASAVARLGDRLVELTVQEGKYHQVKRMVAAAGNRVVALHRHAIGGLGLPADLAEGAWCWLEEPDLARLRG